MKITVHMQRKPKIIYIRIGLILKAVISEKAGTIAIRIKYIFKAMGLPNEKVRKISDFDAVMNQKLMSSLTQEKEL